MNLVRWSDPFQGISSLHSQLDDMFNGFFGENTLAGHSMPVMDVYTEGDKQLIAEVHAPGFTRDDVEVNVNNGVMEIKGEKQEKNEEKDKERSYMLRQSSTSFYRRIALPKHADGDNIRAEFSDGLLKVTVPFKELPKPKRIQISAGKSDKK